MFLAARGGTLRGRLSDPDGDNHGDSGNCSVWICLGVKQQRLRVRWWAMILHPNLARAPVAREHEVAQDIPPDQAVNSVGLQLCAPDLSVDENLVDACIRDPGAQSKDNPPDIYSSGRIDTYPMERSAGVDKLESCLLCELVLNDCPICPGIDQEPATNRRRAGQLVREHLDERE